jgi:hypothetical protein
MRLLLTKFYNFSRKITSALRSIDFPYPSIGVCFIKCFNKKSIAVCGTICPLLRTLAVFRNIDFVNFCLYFLCEYE